MKNFVTRAEDISILRQYFEKESGRILENYFYYLNVQKIPGKSKIPLATPIFLRAIFLHSKSPVIRSSLSTMMKSYFLFISIVFCVF